MCSEGIANVLVDGCSRWSYQEESKEEIQGCGERGYEDSWWDRRRCRGQGEMKEDNSLWQILEKIGTTERGRGL